MADKPEIDEISGIETTGHEWDGIKELNNPLPRWWLWVLYATIIWSLGYWIAMPAWPTFWGYTTGVLGHSDRDRVAKGLAEVQESQAGFRDQIRMSDLEDIRHDAALMEFALAGGRALFGDNCAPCHGGGAAGSRGYPNLNDDDWLWGGTLEEIHATISYGIRADHEETRANEMPAFGRDGILDRGEIDSLADYVLSLSGSGEAAAGAEELFADNCAACHGDAGEGIAELGAPDLTNGLWLYGGEKQDVVESISNSRAGVMPAWDGRLDDVAVKQLTLYVHSLGGGQ